MAVHRTRDGGRTWKRLTRTDAFCANPGTCVTGLRFVTSRVGYMFGSASFMTTDGGRIWTPLRGPQVESVAFSGRNVFRLVYHGSGCPGPCRPALERAATGGHAWTTVRRWPRAPGFGEQLVGGGTNLYVILYGHIAGGAGSAHATIEVSHDLGRTWSSRADPCGGSGAQEQDALAAAAARDLLAVLCTRRTGQGQGSAFTTLSRDAGRTFTAGARVPVTAPEQIAVGNGGNSGGGNFDYELGLSEDGGRSWRVAVRDRKPLSKDLEAGPLQFVVPRAVSWIGSPHVVWLSSDAGRNWRNSPAP